MDKSQPSTDRHGYDLIKPGMKEYMAKPVPISEVIKEAQRIMQTVLKRK